MNKSKFSNCLNCGTPYTSSIEHNVVFCTSCGQSSKAGELKMSTILKDAISNLFNLDGRILHTIKDILFPSKLTQTYVSGKRKYYVNPARLFIFTLLALITTALIKFEIPSLQIGVNEMHFRTEKSKMKQDFDSLLVAMQVSKRDSFVTDSIRKVLFRDTKDFESDTFGIDQLSIGFGTPIEDFGISTYEVMHETPEFIIDKYNITTFRDRLKVRQYIKLYSDPAGGIKYAIKNLSWAILITVILISLFLKLLYIRGNFYLAEHVVLIFNFHSLIFLVGIIFLLTESFISKDSSGSQVNFSINPLLLLTLVVVEFATLKRYYQQGYFKTFIKFLMINASYLFILVLSTVFIALVSILLF